MARPGIAILSRRWRKLGDRVHQPETLPFTQGDDSFRVAGGEGGVTVGVLVVIEQLEEVAIAPAAEVQNLPFSKGYRAGHPLIRYVFPSKCLGVARVPNVG